MDKSELTPEELRALINSDAVFPREAILPFADAWKADVERWKQEFHDQCDRADGLEAERTILLQAINGVPGESWGVEYCPVCQGARNIDTTGAPEHEAGCIAAPEDEDGQD